MNFQLHQNWGISDSVYKIGLGLFVIGSLGLGYPDTVKGDYLVIHSDALGTKSKLVPGIETMSQQEVARSSQLCFGSRQQA